MAGDGRLKILITGGLGYLGWHLTEWFSRREGWDVVVLARPGASPQPGFRCRVIQADIADSEDVKRTIVEPFDYCIHAASVNNSSVPGYSETALRVNAGGTRNVLETMHDCGLKRFVYLSTIHVYGAGGRQIHENTQAAPATDYALTHWFAEQYVKLFHQRSGLPYVILRLTNVYGAPHRSDSSMWHLVLNDLARMAHDRKEIVLKSNGGARRDFVWVGDMCRDVEGVLAAPGAANQTLNISAGRTRAVSELAEMVRVACQKRYGFRVAIRVDETDTTVYPEVFVDSSRLRKLVPGEVHERFEEEIDRMFSVLDEERDGSCPVNT